MGRMFLKVFDEYHQRINHEGNQEEGGVLNHFMKRRVVYGHKNKGNRYQRKNKPRQHELKFFCFLEKVEYECSCKEDDDKWQCA